MPEVLTAALDCLDCGEAFEGSWPGAREDLEDLPVAVQRCPHCEAEHAYAYPGWTYFTEAG